MCGIFAMFQALPNDVYKNIALLLEKYFQLGQSRGPEFSIMKQITNNVLLGFHRLAINGIDNKSHQPICIDGIYLICNGEIYNYKNIYKLLNVIPETNSDCESIIHMYKQYGIEYTLQNLDGVFAFTLYDANIDRVYVARDPFGVRPLYYGKTNNELFVFSSLLKQVTYLCDDCCNFNAGTYLELSLHKDCVTVSKQPTSYTSFNYHHNFPSNNLGGIHKEYCITIYESLLESVKKRVIACERNIACLLSGGLDSSLISALVSKFTPKGQLQTYSIGMSGGTDLEYARTVSKHISSIHNEIILTEYEFFTAIREVIYNIESYDTTTVRASVGNYLVAKYISEHSDAKVIFNGDGSDELTGGYMYFHNCPNDIEFDHECKRLLSNIQYYDVLRSDRCISCHGLEPRTPFLDRTFVHNYLSLPISVRNHNNGKYMEKYLLRKSIEIMDPELLPSSVLWRTKEAFSDGVSSHHNSWYDIIQSNMDTSYTGDEFEQKCKEYVVNPPTTKEQLYYREIFEEYFPGRGDIIPGFWMPQYSETSDSSARHLAVYKKYLKNT